jgi:hypothetical protein
MFVVKKSSSSSIKISISDAFDGGNIKFVGTRPNELDPTQTTDVILHIKPDNYTLLEKIGHMQYFCFRATISGLGSPKCAVGGGLATHKVKYIIENAEASSYPEAWFGESILTETSSFLPFLFDLTFSLRHDNRNNCVLLFKC